MSDRTYRIYVGRLSNRVRERDLDEVFGKFGKIRKIDMKMGYAFVVSIFTADYLFFAIFMFI